MVAMKSVTRLRLEPRPSRIAGVAIVTACSGIAILVALLRLPVAATFSCTTMVVAVLASSLWRCTGRGVPALLHVGIDRRIAVTDRAGRTRAGAVLDDSYVGPTLTTLVWRADDDPWWRPARAMLILPDTLPPDAFRRLRVVLRYGRPAGEAPTSGVEAG
jgi:hypothetical protein